MAKYCRQCGSLLGEGNCPKCHPAQQIPISPPLQAEPPTPPPKPFAPPAYGDDFAEGFVPPTRGKFPLSHEGTFESWKSSFWGVFSGSGTGGKAVVIGAGILMVLYFLLLAKSELSGQTFIKLSYLCGYICIAAGLALRSAKSKQRDPLHVVGALIFGVAGIGQFSNLIHEYWAASHTFSGMLVLLYSQHHNEQQQVFRQVSLGVLVGALALNVLSQLITSGSNTLLMLAYMLGYIWIFFMVGRQFESSPLS